MPWADRMTWTITIEAVLEMTDLSRLAHPHSKILKIIIFDSKIFENYKILKLLPHRSLASLWVPRVQQHLFRTFWVLFDRLSGCYNAVGLTHMIQQNNENLLKIFIFS